MEAANVGVLFDAIHREILSSSTQDHPSSGLLRELVWFGKRNEGYARLGVP